MSIEALILDLESQMQAQLDNENRLLRSELLEAERAQINLIERFSAARGRKVDVFLIDGRILTLFIVRVGKDWILGRLEEWEYLIPLSAIVSLKYLPRACQPLTDFEMRFSIESVIRTMARRRTRCRWTCVSGEWAGEILATGKDWVDFRSGESNAVLTFVKTGLVSLVSLHRMGR